jgi:hypothetical protein
MGVRLAAKVASLQAVKVAAELVDLVHQPPRGIVVLIYHRVGGRTCEVDLSTSVFDRQMRFLSEHAHPVTLDAAVALLADPQPPAVDPVVGTADFAEAAVPILVRHGVPATMYLATAFVEEQRAFPDDGRPISWQALRDVVSTGLVGIGSHTHTHALLDRIDVEAAERELDTSVGLIQDRLGVEARHFAYPKALCGSPPVREAIRRRFASAAVGGGRTNPYGTTDPQLLFRSPIHVSDGVGWFRRKAAGGLAFEDVLRNRLNRRRYADASM